MKPMNILVRMLIVDGDADEDADVEENADVDEDTDVDEDVGMSDLVET